MLAKFTKFLTFFNLYSKAVLSNKEQHKLNVEEEIFFHELNKSTNQQASFLSDEIKNYLNTLIEKKNYNLLLNTLDNGASLTNQQYVKVLKDFSYFMNNGGDVNKLDYFFTEKNSSINSPKIIKNLIREDIVALLKITFHKDYLELIKSNYAQNLILPEKKDHSLLTNGFSFFITENSKTHKNFLEIKNAPEAFELFVNFLILDKDKTEKKFIPYLSMELFSNFYENSHSFLKTERSHQSHQLFDILNNQLTKWNLPLLEKRFNYRNNEDIAALFLEKIADIDYFKVKSFLVDFFDFYNKNGNTYRYQQESILPYGAIDATSSDYPQYIEKSFEKFNKLRTFFKSKPQHEHTSMLKKIQESTSLTNRKNITLDNFNPNYHSWNIPYEISNVLNKYILLLSSLNHSASDVEVKNYSQNVFTQILDLHDELEQLHQIQELNVSDTLEKVKPMLEKIEETFKKHNEQILSTLKTNVKSQTKKLRA